MVESAPIGGAVAELDIEQIEMSTGGDLEFAGELAEIYDESVRMEFEGLRSTLAAGDTAVFGRHAHTIKGASANMGANLVRDLAYELETMGKAGNLAGADEKIVALEAAFERVVEQIRVYAKGG